MSCLPESVWKDHSVVSYIVTNDAKNLVFPHFFVHPFINQLSDMNHVAISIDLHQKDSYVLTSFLKHNLQERHCKSDPSQSISPFILFINPASVVLTFCLIHSLFFPLMFQFGVSEEKVSSALVRIEITSDK